MPAYSDSSVTYLGLNDLLSEQEKTNEYKWKIVANGFSMSEDTNKALGFATKLQAELKFHLSPKFNILLDAGLSWFSGNTQYDLKDYSNDSIFFADEVSLNYDLTKYFTVSAGALNQGFLDAGLLISGRAFPGLREKLSIETKKYEIALIAQQLIPTSNSFNDERSEEEELPSFYTGSLIGHYNFASPISNLPTAKLKTALGLTLFQFSDLPAIAAEKGSLYGHTNQGEGPNSKFRYEFAGYLINAGITLEDENNYEFCLCGYWADNTKAEVNDRLQSLSVNVNKTVGNYVVGLSVENFFKDSEVSPAVYSSGYYGGNNREGNAYKVELEFKKYKFKLAAHYYDLDVITKNSIQDARETYYLGVETLYVKF